MSDSFEKWASDKTFMLRVSAGDGYVNVKEMARIVWQAALQSGEPVGHALACGDPEVTIATFNADRVSVGTKLYTTPQPVIPEGYVLVPIHALGEWVTEDKGDDE
jgi:hypothetical protein